MIKKLHSFLFENTSTKQTIMKNTIWLLFSEIISKGFALLGTIFIARDLGPDNFGQFSYIINFVGIFIFIVDFGFSVLLIREGSRNSSNTIYLINFFIKWKCIFSILFLLLIIVLGLINRDSMNILYVILYGLYGIFNSFSQFLRSTFRITEQMQFEAYNKISSGIILFGIITIIFLSSGGLKGYFVGYLFSGLLTLILIVIQYRRFFHEKTFPDKNSLINKKHLLNEGFKISISVFLVQIYLISDQFLLGYFGFTKELGYYSIYVMFITALGLPIISYIQAFLPSFSKLKSDRYSSFINEKILKIIGITISLALVFFLLKDWIFYITVGSNYLPQSNSYVLFILVLCFIMNSINFFYGEILLFSGNVYYHNIITGIGGVLNLILNIIFIPIYGLIGAATTTLLSQFLVLVLIFSFIYKKYYYAK